MEHDRWNREMMEHGWRYAPVKKCGDERNTLSCRYEQPTEEIKITTATRSAKFPNYSPESVSRFIA